MYCIGITGPIASGKETTAAYLREFIQLNYFCMSDIVKREAKKKGVPETKRAHQLVGNELRKEKGNDYLAKCILDIMRGDCIIDGIRNPAEVEYLKKKMPGFMLISVNAEPEKRFERVLKRRKPTDVSSWEEFVKIDDKDVGVDEPPYGQGVKYCMRMADFKLENNGSFEDLKKQVEVLSSLITSKSSANL